MVMSMGLDFKVYMEIRSSCLIACLQHEYVSLPSFHQGLEVKSQSSGNSMRFWSYSGKVASFFLLRCSFLCQDLSAVFEYVAILQLTSSFIHYSQRNCLRGE